jgi:hypothetical protein
MFNKIQMTSWQKTESYQYHIGLLLAPVCKNAQISVLAKHIEGVIMIGVKLGESNQAATLGTA